VDSDGDEDAAPAALVPAPVAPEASPRPDTPPLLIERTTPQVPAGVPPQSLPATVGLLLSVNESGDVFHAEVAQSSGDDRLDTAAVRGVLDWHYDPALRGARAVPAQVPAQVTFSR
jgi:TonB family protein